ncbi:MULTISPECIES: hypothetical protein [Haloferax]|uniref:DUF7999 domain-containing protein n=1 Tax=Haloferax marinum TaxID=2666143 RepID=A0A6A8G952_9EURY|nr:MULTISPECIES: hypothetical protein [Haloferax]KAB1198420.1 hypothetical protein Hfx1150_13210 [Haloferax sp. CBA1150]MRW97521.1 hypothetical protein [Haloferax marinum]
MPELVSTNSVKSYTVVNSVNDHGAATVRDEDGSTYHITSYDDDVLREHLADHRPGEQVRMDIERAGVRANVWQVSALYPGIESQA